MNGNRFVTLSWSRLMLLCVSMMIACVPVYATTPDTIYVSATSASVTPDTLECNHVYKIIIDNPTQYSNIGYTTDRTRYRRFVSRNGDPIHVRGSFDMRIGSNPDRVRIGNIASPMVYTAHTRTGNIDTVMASGSAAIRVDTYSANRSATVHTGFELDAWVCCLDNEIQDITVSAITASSAQITWNDASTATRWVVYYGFTPSMFSDSIVVTSPSVTLTGLDDNTPYHFTIYNNAATTSAFALCTPNSTTFTTTASADLPHGCVNYLALHSSAVSARYGMYLTPGATMGVVDYGSSNINSRHTIHRDTSERDPRTGGLLRTVPQGAEASVRLGNWASHNQAEQLQYTFVVDTTVSDLLLLRYAAVLQYPNDHATSIRPRLQYAITHVDGTPVGADGCYDVEFISDASLGWHTYGSGSESINWKDWTSVGVNLSGMHGDTLVVTITTKDCNEASGTNAGSHFGYAYFTLGCGTAHIDFTGCYASTGDVVTAPEGFTYSWHRVGETTELSADQSFTIPATGSYACDLHFVGASGSSCMFTLNVESSGTYPVADFTYAITPIETDTFSVSFTDATVIYNGNTPDMGASASSLLWQFPDGTTASGTTVTHQFNQPGSYDVTLIATLDDECIDTIVKTLTLRSSRVQPDNIDSIECAFSPVPTDWSIRLDAIVGHGDDGDSICTLINPLVGDLDGDGIPEIVCFATRNASITTISGNGNPGTQVKSVLVYDGRTLRRKAAFDLPSYVSAFEATPFGLAKPYDGDALMVFACTNNQLYAYKLNGSGGATQVWGGVSYGSGTDYATTVGFADFNNDSIPEVYVRNRIFNLATGELLLTVGSANSGSTYAHVGSSGASLTSRKPLAASFASDVVGDQHCELLLGSSIYSIDITNPHGTTGNSATLYATAPSTGVSGISDDGHAQVGDFNLDGHLDIFFSCRPALGNSTRVYFYVWDVYNNTVSTPVAEQVSAPGKSIPLLADIDNDDTLEVVIHIGIPGNNVRAYKYHEASNAFTLFWTKGFAEDSYSNGMTLFDFNQDGENELLISDNNRVSIVNGSTPALAQNTLSYIDFYQITIMQYPLIADIDNDGAAEIIFVGKQNMSSYQGTLNVCRSNGDPWAPARPVWNQYMYNVTNVNKDLTIPPAVFNNATAFTDPDDGTVRRPYNHFMQQATSLDSYGRPYYTASDLQPSNYSVELVDAGVHVAYDICNVGLSIFSADTIYNEFRVGSETGDHIANVLLYGDASLPLQLLPDSCRRVDFVIPYSRICPFVPFDSIAITVNDNGNGVASAGLPAECNVENNTIYLPVEILIYRDTVNDSICRGSHYNNHGFDVPDDTTAVLGMHILCDTVADPVHCQAIHMLRLMVLDGFVADTVAVACDSLVWHGNRYILSGDYSFSTLSQQGCDSVVNLHLTIGHSSATDTMATVCDSLVWYDTILTQSTVLDHTWVTDQGCDSVKTLHLTVNTSYAMDSTAQACNTYTWADGQQFSQSGEYTLAYHSTEGCDSVWTLHLSIYSDTAIVDDQQGCDTVVYNGIAFTVDTLLSDTLQTVHGCDSVLSIRLRVYPTYNDTVVDSMPIGAVYHFNGQDYFDSGTYQALLTSVNQCDSLVTLYLTLYDLCEIFLQFPNLVTPNGDGINDRFVIHNLVEEGCYPLNHLTIYNRWGARVFDKENISSDSDFWDPAEHNISAGTYFFIFRGKGHKGRVERRGVIEVIK